MNCRERIRMALDFKEPDKVPSFEMSIDNFKICEHFNEDYVFQGMVKSFNDTYDLCHGDTDSLTSTIIRATETRSYIKNTLNRHINLYRKLGIDLAIIPFTGYILFPKNCDRTFFTDEYGRIFDLRKNPSDGMDIAYYRDGAFKNFEEFEKYSHLKVKTSRREKYFKAMKKTEKESQGNISIIPAVWGLFEPSWQVFGFSTFSKLLANPRKIKKVFDIHGKFLVDSIKTFIDWGETDAIMIMDDYGFKSGPLMSPKNYKNYVFPWLEESCKIAHNAGLKVILHSCGDIIQLLDDIIRAGVDAIHPIEPSTANPEYDIFKLNEKYHDKLCFLGNVSPQDLADKEVNVIENYTKKLIEKLAPEGGFILSSGHSINPSVKLENYLAMHNTLKKYGTYPIFIH
ncbi:MAG: uroporphyrinogen decarboxylase family protein [Candidatus Lokiarchaeia archaeon]